MGAQTRGNWLQSALFFEALRVRDAALAHPRELSQLLSRRRTLAVQRRASGA
jgi:hypothetical protein